jgi:hypothetical protein
VLPVPAGCLPTAPAGLKEAMSSSKTANGAARRNMSWSLLEYWGVTVPLASFDGQRHRCDGAPQARVVDVPLGQG